MLSKHILKRSVKCKRCDTDYVPWTCFVLASYYYEAVIRAERGYRAVIGHVSINTNLLLSVFVSAAFSSRVVQSMWELLLRMITDAVTENRGVQVEFYNRFQYTVEVSAAVPGVQIRKVHPDSFLASTVGPQLKTTCVKIIITTVIVIIHQLAPRAHCRAIISICSFSGDSVDVSLVSSVNSSRE